MEHEFTKTINSIIEKKFPKLTKKIFTKSELIKYINIKTKSANKGSKSRGSFANLYAIYVLVEDYISKGFHKKGNYKKYEGAIFSSLFNRQRKLPFANDGGIDFVMKPLGRFFQVTETIDVKKYFLDIDKIEKYPITFVVKSSDSSDNIRQKIKEQAEKQYSIIAIVSRYMSCIEEIINIPELIHKFNISIKNGFLKDVLTEIIKQSKVEFNYDEDDFDV